MSYRFTSSILDTCKDPHWEHQGRRRITLPGDHRRSRLSHLKRNCSTITRGGLGPSCRGSRLEKIWYLLFATRHGEKLASLYS